MTTLEALFSIFDGFLKSRQYEFYSQVAKVTSIDRVSFSCEVELLRGGKRKEARLTASLDNGSGVVVYPKQGSNVIVSFLDETTVFINKYSDVDEIVIHGGTNGGMVKVNELVAYLTKVSADLSTLQAQLASWPVAGFGAPLGLVFVPTATAPTVAQFENQKIKQ